MGEAKTFFSLGVCSWAFLGVEVEASTGGDGLNNCRVVTILHDMVAEERSIEALSMLEPLASEYADVGHTLQLEIEVGGDSLLTLSLFTHTRVYNETCILITTRPTCRPHHKPESASSISSQCNTTPSIDFVHAKR